MFEAGGEAFVFFNSNYSIICNESPVSEASTSFIIWFIIYYNLFIIMHIFFWIFRLSRLNMLILGYSLNRALNLDQRYTTNIFF